MASLANLMDGSSPVFRAYLFYSAVLVLKMLAMSMLTARQRFRKKIFANVEDAKIKPGAKVKYDDQDVERVRRAHLNDLENIPVFFVAAFLYVMTDPVPFIAINLFRAFTAARILHTIVYAVKPLPQPSRALAFFVGYGVTAYMAVVGLIRFL